MCRLCAPSACFFYVLCFFKLHGCWANECNNTQASGYADKWSVMDQVILHLHESLKVTFHTAWLKFTSTMYILRVTLFLTRSQIYLVFLGQNNFSPASHLTTTWLTDLCGNFIFTNIYKESKDYKLFLPPNKMCLFKTKSRNSGEKRSLL